MKISLKWINELVDVEEYFSRPMDLGDLLTAAGLEVEDMQDGAKNFHQVVVGQVVEKGQHPDADKLSLCQVSTGDKSHQIICGAQNHKQGDRVVVALPGAVLPGDFAIKKSKIRGVESLGMLCSNSELGREGDSEGIIILPEDAPLGEPIAKYLGLDDVVFELKVTPNRADCLSHIGLAREIGSLLKRPLKVNEPKVEMSGGDTQKTFGLDVNEAEKCPRFTGVVLKGVQVKESPAWMKSRLEALGINSINNIVDITNYVMLEYGQPMHAYDMAALSGEKLIVANSGKGEKFTTFDGTEVELTGEELTIRDSEKCVGLAGVIGGKNSGVSETTKDVFLECAYFTPASIRKTSRRFGIETDACYRFTRGVDPAGVKNASLRAASLMQEHAGAEVYSNHWDFYPEPVCREPIFLEKGLMTDRLGYEVSDSETHEILQRLGCELKEDSSGVRVQPPLFRWDLEQPMDLVEEVARMKGYDKIPEVLPVSSMEPTGHTKEYGDLNDMADILTGQGFLQAVNHSFESSTFQNEIIGPVETWKKLGLKVAEEAVRIRNPLNEELDVMRRSLLPWLLKNLFYNSHHGNHQGRLFELGRVFDKTDSGYSESWRLSLALWGKKQSLWQVEKAPAVFELKGRIDNMLDKLGVRSYSWSSESEVPGVFHPGQTAVLRAEGKVLGAVGSLHPSIRESEKIREEVALAEFDFDLLMARHPRKPKFSSVSRFPAVDRDLAFVVPQELAVEKIAGGIKKAAGKSLVSVEVVDSFEGEGVDPGHRSVTFRMKYQDLNQTLDDGLVSELQNKIIDAVKTQFSVSVR